jgi:two-component system, OmpR family, KDP operon response regulator KdpE
MSSGQDFPAVSSSAGAERPRRLNHAAILVVDDEPQIRRVLRSTLFSAGYEVMEATDGQEGIELLLREHPDLVLLDVNLPDISGFETCSRMRLSFAGPILMVTVRNAVRDKIDALNSGADDYVVKPFAMEELLARIRAALRRVNSTQPPIKIETPDLTIDFEKRIVAVRGERAHLTPKEFEVLRALVTQQGKPVSCKRILQGVWGPDYGEEIEKVRGVIGQLRRKIEKDPANPRYIFTEPWYGYGFQLPSEARRRP